MSSEQCSHLLAGLHLEAMMESDDAARLSLTGDLVPVVACAAGVPGAATGERVVLALARGAGTVGVAGTVAAVVPSLQATAAAALPPRVAEAVALLRKSGGGSGGGGLACIAVQAPFVEMPLLRGASAPLEAAPFNLFQVESAALEAFLAAGKSGNGDEAAAVTPLLGHRVSGVYADGTTQFGVVDLVRAAAAAHPREVLATQLPCKGGLPGQVWEMSASVFGDLPFKADLYIHPADRERVYFGLVEEGEDAVKPYGALALADAAARVAEARSAGARVTLDACPSVEHDAVLARVLCRRIVLDRGCDPVDPTRPGAWEILNDPSVVLQLCFAFSQARILTRLDRGDNPAPVLYKNLNEVAAAAAAAASVAATPASLSGRGANGEAKRARVMPLRRPRSPPPRR